MEDKTQTEFNSNVATLERIDNLLRKCTEASFHGDLHSWCNLLYAVRREAIVKVKDETLKKQFMEQLPNIGQQLKLWQNNRQSMQLKENLITQLDDYEIEIRKLMDKKGMLLKNIGGTDETPPDW